MGYKIYYVYGFMLLVFLILLTVTVCVTIVCTYFLLNAEDYRWQWTSFMAAGSTAGYVFFYSFYYFFFKTKMYGLFQTTFYFGYMGVFSLSLGILWHCGLCWNKCFCEENLRHSENRLKWGKREEYNEK